MRLFHREYYYVERLPPQRPREIGPTPKDAQENGMLGWRTILCIVGATIFALGFAYFPMNDRRAASAARDEQSVVTLPAQLEDIITDPAYVRCVCPCKTGTTSGPAVEVFLIRIIEPGSNVSFVACEYEDESIDFVNHDWTRDASCPR